MDIFDRDSYRRVRIEVFLQGRNHGRQQGLLQVEHRGYKCEGKIDRETKVKTEKGRENKGNNNEQTRRKLKTTGNN